MTVLAITGHQRRPGFDWAWVEETLRTEIEARAAQTTCLWSCLAVGADTLAAEAALEAGVPLGVLIPYIGYENGYGVADRERFDALVARAAVVERLDLPRAIDVHRQAGRWLVETADHVLAVWDGAPAAGPGGTAEVVAEAREHGRVVTWIDPIRRCVVRPSDVSEAPAGD